MDSGQKHAGMTLPVKMKLYKKILLFLLLVFTITWIFLPKPPLMDGISFSQAFFDSDNHLLRLTLSSDDKYRQFVPLSQIEPRLVEATLLKEDRYFYWHLGINPYSLLRAIWSTYISGDKKLGASTITMQLARIRYDIHTRSFGGKIKQMWMALELERHYSKKEILEAYLNLAPYGRNIEGVGAASLIYYHKKASQLNLPEVLTLVSIPQSPQLRSPEQASHLQEARSQLFDLWIAEHPEDKSQKFLVDSSFVAGTPENLPFLAPHFVNSLLLRQLSSSVVVSGSFAELMIPWAPVVLNRRSIKSEIITTLDLGLQKILERHITSYVERHGDMGIQNASAMIIDYRTMQIKAVVGSVDFFSAEIDGQVNGTQAKRSPGSALKPFVYALAIDQGIIHPATLLKDTASSFGGYDPENFDHEFLGPISAREALIKSRNIPAVALAAQVDHPNLYEFYQEAEISKLRPPEVYGLTTALGGFEVTMEEMARLYAMLANGGMYRQIVSQNNQNPDLKSKRLLSPEASYLTLDILGDNPPPDNFKTSIPVYWKTGTSYSYRDAWTAGIFGPYVMVVWIGNFDGKGNPTFVGRSASAPLFFEIVEHIKPGGKSAMATINQNNQLNMKRVEVCALSGALMGPHCPHAAQTLFIPGKSPIRVCDIHRRIAIDPKNGLRACSDSQPGVKFSVYEFWPSDLLTLFKNAGFPRLEPPPYEPGCNMTATASKGNAPQILSPKRGVKYVIRIGQETNNQIPLRAILDEDTKVVFWFANDLPIGSSFSNKTVYWTPTPGHYVIRVVDGNGRTAKQDLDVEAVQ